jgi:hypothetical protein
VNNNTVWDKINSTIAAVAGAYIAIKTAAGVKQPSSTPVVYQNPNLQQQPGDTFQYVTLGIAGIALVAALVMLFAGKK